MKPILYYRVISNDRRWSNLAKGIKQKQLITTNANLTFHLIIRDAVSQPKWKAKFIYFSLWWRIFCFPACNCSGVRNKKLPEIHACSKPSLFQTKRTISWASQTYQSYHITKSTFTDRKNNRFIKNLWCRTWMYKYAPPSYRAGFIRHWLLNDVRGWRVFHERTIKVNGWPIICFNWISLSHDDEYPPFRGYFQTIIKIFKISWPFEEKN